MSEKLQVGGNHSNSPFPSKMATWSTRSSEFSEDVKQTLKKNKERLQKKGIEVIEIRGTTKG